MNFKLYAIISIIFLMQCIFTQDEESSSTLRLLERRRMFESLNEKYKTSLERYYQERSIIRTISPQVLEDTLDVFTYIIGPGDVFEIYILGGLQEKIMGENQHNFKI